MNLVLTKGLANLNLIYANVGLAYFSGWFSNILDVLLRINVVFLVIYLFYIFEKKALEFTFYFTYFSAFFQSLVQIYQQLRFLSLF